jgi:hypothetical protein
MENKELREWMSSNYTVHYSSDKLAVVVANTIIGTTEFKKENQDEEKDSFLSPLTISSRWTVGKSIETEEIVINRILNSMIFHYYDILLKLYREQQINKLI